MQSRHRRLLRDLRSRDRRHHPDRWDPARVGHLRPDP